MQNDEAIYSYAVRSLLETGDWLNPRSSPSPDIVFVEKPPLKFWIVALPIRLGLLPDDEFGLRFWDAVFGSLAFLYVFAFGWRLAGPFCGAIACLVLFGFQPLLFEHGLRSNNMEAALLLAYCGGAYHYARWAGSAPAEERQRGAWRRPGALHALAVGFYVFLGFMTKFVAVAFLPLVLGVATLVVPPARARLRRDWRLWLGGAGLMGVLAAPWFLYEMTKPGDGVWSVMLGEHVLRRFSASLDPSHVQPWDYYFSFLSLFLHQERIFRTAVVAGLVLLVSTLWTRRLEGVLTVSWFVLPLALISLGTSKLGHYAYPYLPPIGLAVGYLMAHVLRVGVGLADGHPPAWVAAAVPAGWRERVRHHLAVLQAARHRWRERIERHRAAAIALLVLRAALGLQVAIWLLLAVIAMVHPGRLTVAGLVLARHPQPISLAVNALLLAALIGRLRITLRVALPIILITLAPLKAYHERLPALLVERHELRNLGACLADVREQERRAGRGTREMLVALPEGFLHPYFFYLRTAGWDARDEAAPEALATELDTAGLPRPALVSADRYRSAWEPRVSSRAIRGWTVFDHRVVLLMPGPFARCER